MNCRRKGRRTAPITNLFIGMKKEKIELLEQQDTNYDIKNRIVKGFIILEKYCDDISIEPGHDEIYAYLEEDDQYNAISDEDIVTLGKLGWMWSEEFEGFNHFT